MPINKRFSMKMDAKIHIFFEMSKEYGKIFYNSLFTKGLTQFDSQ